MRRKGSLTIDQVIKMVVVAAVLIIVALALWAFYTGQFNWGKGIPIPGQQNLTIKVESATFRYLPASDKVEYYTGTTWEGFNGKNLDIGDKRIKYETIRQNFYDYYFISPTKELVKIPSNYQNEIYGRDYVSDINGDLRGIPSLNAKIVLLQFVDTDANNKRGMVRGMLVPQDSNDIKSNYGIFLVSLTGEFLLNKIKKDLSDLVGKYEKQDVTKEPYKTISEKAVAWRDSVLKKPVTLSTSVLKDKKEVEQKEKYCLEKINYQGEISLVVRLEEPASGESC